MNNRSLLLLGSVSAVKEPSKLVVQASCWVGTSLVFHAPSGSGCRFLSRSRNEMLARQVGHDDDQILFKTFRPALLLSEQEEIWLALAKQLK